MEERRRVGRDELAKRQRLQATYHQYGGKKAYEKAMAWEEEERRLKAAAAESTRGSSVRRRSGGGSLRLPARERAGNG